MSIVIRGAIPSESLAVAAVIRQSFAQYRRGRNGPRAAFTSGRAVAADLRSGRRGYAVARLGSRIVGALRWHRAGCRVALSRLGVLPAYRRQGIGSALLRWAGRRARGMGARTLTGTVLWGLPSLVRFYRRLGFAVHHRRGLVRTAKRIG